MTAVSSATWCVLIVCLLPAPGLAQFRPIAFPSPPRELTFGIEGGVGGSSYGTEYMAAVHGGAGPLIMGISIAVSPGERDLIRRQSTWCFSPGLQVRLKHVRFRGVARLSYRTGEGPFFADETRSRRSFGLGYELTASLPITSAVYAGIQGGRDITTWGTTTFLRATLSIWWDTR